MSYKLFTPGPVAVSERTLQAMAQWVMPHRSEAFVRLFRSVQPGLQALFGTRGPVYLSTSSSWGAMEGSIRNVAKKGVLNIMNGAFSDKWNDVAARNGLSCGALRYEWGQAVNPADVRRELASGRYDAVSLIHCETSTGTLSPLRDIMAVVREFDDVISVVDTVSSFATMPIPKDELGIDVMITGSQKALALPPGMSILSVGERALERSKSVQNRGYYFDFQEFQRNWEGGMTPTTPVIPLIYALQDKLAEVFEEGLEARYARHARLNALVRRWGAEKHGFSLLPEPQFGALGLNCFRNDREIDLPGLRAALRERYRCDIDGGYGKLKGKTFRISNMGNETGETMQTLLAQLDEVLPQFMRG